MSVIKISLHLIQPIRRMRARNQLCSFTRFMRHVVTRTIFLLSYQLLMSYYHRCLEINFL